MSLCWCFLIKHPAELLIKNKSFYLHTYRIFVQLHSHVFVIDLCQSSSLLLTGRTGIAKLFLRFAQRELRGPVRYVWKILKSNIEYIEHIFFPQIVFMFYKSENFSNKSRLYFYRNGNISLRWICFCLMLLFCSPFLFWFHDIVHIFYCPQVTRLSFSDTLSHRLDDHFMVNTNS